MKFALSTRPEISRHVIRRSLSIYRHSFLHVFYLSLLLSTVVFLPHLLSLLVGQDIFVSLPLFSVQRLWLLTLNIAGLVFFVAILWRIYCLVINKHESLAEDFLVGLKKSPSIIVGALFQYIVMILIILLISAFVYFVVLNKNTNLLNANTFHSVLTFLLLISEICLLFLILLAFYFYLPIITIENQGILASLKKSMKVIWGNVGRAMYVQSTPWLAYLLCLVFVKVIVNMNISIYFLSPGRETLLNVLLQIVMFAIFVPWIATTLFVQLRDLELRHNEKTANPSLE
jgi:hypothetical protein